MNAQQQQLQQSNRHKRMKRIEISETKKEKETCEAGERRNQYRLPRPVQTTPYSKQRKREIKQSDRHHHTGKRDAIVGHEVEQVSIDRGQYIARYSEKRFIVRQHDPRGRNNQ